ncbi:MAG: hypothetical protein E7012_06515 [Alphaproteobacteria bacterium]|nr:hypothetical protein [Alphaproteobacteria bacterium]
MEKHKKYAALDAIDAATEIPTNPNKPIFSIGYKRGNEFEILPEFIPERKGEIWGYEILPNILLAKKCGPDGNVISTTWNNVKSFADACKLEGKNGSLPFKEILYQNRAKGLPQRIKLMDNFLRENGVDAEEEAVGKIWCYEVYDLNYAYYFDLDCHSVDWSNKNCFYEGCRLAVAF